MIKDDQRKSLDPSGSILFGAMHRHPLFFALQTATNMKLLGSKNSKIFLMTYDLCFPYENS